MMMVSSGRNERSFQRSRRHQLVRSSASGKRISGKDEAVIVLLTALNSDKALFTLRFCSLILNYLFDRNIVDDINADWLFS
jgi:hypothetical protein